LDFFKKKIQLVVFFFFLLRRNIDFDLLPLLHEHNEGVKEGLGVNYKKIAIMVCT